MLGYLFLTTSCLAQSRCDSVTDKMMQIECKKAELDSLNYLLVQESKKLLLNVGEFDKKCFESSEVDWKNYRERFCECYSSILKGNQSQRNYYDCFIKLTVERLNQVKEMDNIH